MILGNELLNELGKLKIKRLCIPRGFKCRGNYLQCIAVQLLIGKYELCSNGKGRVVLLLDEKPHLGKSDEEIECQASLVKTGKCKDPIKLTIKPPREPIFIIDLALWHKHTDSEKNELIEQILASISTVREYLWDGNMMLTSINDEALSYMMKFAGNAKFRLTISKEGPPKATNAVFLDPGGDCLLNEELINKSSIFIIGGIVDKERKSKGESHQLYLYHGLNDAPRCRIELRNSIVGVPDRINKIIEIILSTRYETHDLEKAIIMSMSKRDRINRLFYELQRASYTVRTSGLKIIPNSMIKAINWMMASDEEVKIAIKRAKINIVNDEEFRDYIVQGILKEGPWSHKYKSVIEHIMQ